MPGPFYNAIKGTTVGAPGTGAFTPNAASSGFRAWSTVPTGWIGLVRYEDGSDWELSYSYWNGTTLSRATSQRYDSSTGAVLTLTSAATAAMIPDASELQPHLAGTRLLIWEPVAGNSTVAIYLGIGSPTATGTAAAAVLATTNYLTEQVRLQITSATTASAQAGLSWIQIMGVVSTAAGRGGFEFVSRFGASQLPTGPRLFVGMSSSTVVGASEPSAITASLAGFAKDSTDTNIQMLVNSNAGSGTKTDTGIALVANGWYEAAIWCEPGSNTVYGLLVRLDTGAIWYGSTATDVPANGALLMPYVEGGLSATTGTAIIMQIGSVAVRNGT